MDHVFENQVTVIVVSDENSAIVSFYKLGEGQLGAIVGSV
jgi:hypothetical protein